MSDNTIVFHEPVRPGDRLRTRQILRSVSDEKTTKLGTGRFWVIDVEYHNQRGDLVAVESYTGFGYRRAGEEAGAVTDPDHCSQGDGRRWATRCPSWPTRSPPPPSCSGRWPPATGGPCTTTRTSPSTATAPGTSSSTRPTWPPGSSATSPTGPGRYGRLQRVTFRMLGSIFPGDTMVFRGTVTDTGVDDTGCGWAAARHRGVGRRRHQDDLRRPGGPAASTPTTTRGPARGDRWTP